MTTSVHAGMTVTHSQAPHAAALPAVPSLTMTVPREYVHRAAVAEVFLTGWRQSGPDQWTVTAQWPRGHCFYGPVAGYHDPLLFSETLRQTVPLLSHTVFDAPMDHKQIWQNLRVALEPEALRAESTPASVELHIRCADIERRGGAMRSMRMEVTATRDGRRLAVATTSFTNHGRALYRRLRGAYADAEAAMADAVALPLPVRPELVGRDRRHDVVLAPTAAEGHWQLRVDTMHPIVFDHPNDHAPGMLLLEAARQAAQALQGPAPVLAVGMESSFHRYVELDAPAWVEAVSLSGGAGGAGLVRVSVEQEGALAFECVVTTHPAG